MRVADKSPEYQQLLGYFRTGQSKSVLDWFKESELSPKQGMELVESILRDIGDLWRQEKVPLTAVYVASMVTQELTDIILEDQIAKQEKRGVIVLGTMAEDYHSLGKNIVKRFLVPFFEVHDLGNDVAIELFLKTAKEKNADIVAVSAVMMNSVGMVYDMRKAIDATSWNRKPLLLVGGAPFVVDPSLAEVVGADAWAASVFDVVDMCMALIGGVP